MFVEITKADTKLQFAFLHKGTVTTLQFQDEDSLPLKVEVERDGDRNHWTLRLLPDGFKSPDLGQQTKTKQNSKLPESKETPKQNSKENGIKKKSKARALNEEHKKTKKAKKMSPIELCQKLDALFCETGKLRLIDFTGGPSMATEVIGDDIMKKVNSIVGGLTWARAWPIWRMWNIDRNWIVNNKLKMTACFEAARTVWKETKSEYKDSKEHRLSTLETKKPPLSSVLSNEVDAPSETKITSVNEVKAASESDDDNEKTEEGEQSDHDDHNESDEDQDNKEGESNESKTKGSDPDDSNVKKGYKCIKVGTRYIFVNRETNDEESDHDTDEEQTDEDTKSEADDDKPKGKKKKWNTDDWIKPVKPGSTMPIEYTAPQLSKRAQKVRDEYDAIRCSTSCSQYLDKESFGDW
jgi:hypothetical protein